MPPCNVTVAEYRALITELRVSPFQERIVNERAGTPGLRQLTLWERVDHVMPNRPAPGDSNGGQNITNRLAAISFSAPGPRASVRTHPWQCEPQLPDRVTIDFTHDHPELLPAPPGWELLRRNGRLLLRNPSGFTCQLEAAQAGMLERMQEGMDQVCFLEALFEACSSQQRQDDSRAVHWSRHLLACIARISGARGLVGCHSVTFHPHYCWFSSPTLWVRCKNGRPKTLYSSLMPTHLQDGVRCYDEPSVTQLVYGFFDLWSQGKHQRKI